MTNETNERRLHAILHAYLQARDRGESPDRQALLDAHPDLREELAEYFADASKLDALAKSLKTQSFGGGSGEASPSLGKVRYFGDYELLEEIARGGMGVVFKAKQVSLNRVVALKMILKGELASEADVRRFRQEAEAAANLDHPNIVPIYEVGEHEGQQYFSMKVIGVGAREEGQGASKEGQRKVAEVVAKVARAVHHAHQRGILHRDLKPSNILIDQDGEPHVADFGLAKRIEGGVDATRSGAIVGTPAYMAPEQARAEKSLTTAVDVYSLGAILYEWLTGRPPFLGEDAVSILMKAALEEPPKPRSLNERIHRDLETITLKCLEKKPEKRYLGTGELADDLDRFLRGEPIFARPVGQLERACKWVGRNPLVAAMLVVIVGAATVSGFFAHSASVEARAAQDRAISEAQAKRIAQSEARRADAETRRAEMELLKSQRLVYAGKLSLAQSAFAEGNCALALQYLDECRWNLRGWEHRYLWTRFNSRQTFLERGTDVCSVAYSPDGKRILTGNGNGTTRIWDAEIGRVVLSLQGHKGEVLGVTFSPDGKRVATGSRDRSVRISDAASGVELFTLQGHRGGVYCVAFSPDGRRIVTGSHDGTAKLWDAEKGRELFPFKGHAGAVTSVAYSPDGTRLVTGSHDTTTIVWDAKTGQPLFELKGHSGPVFGVAYSPDGCRIVTGSQDNTARVWEATRGKEHLVIKGHADRVSSVAFSPDGQRLVTGSWDTTARVWDAATGRELLALKGHMREVASVAFSPDGMRIVTGSEDQTAKVWDANQGQEALAFDRHGSQIRSAAFSPDGKWIATGSDDHTAKSWNPHTGRELLTLIGHTGPVLGVAFGSDSQRIVTGSQDGTARVWNSETGRTILDLKGHDNSVTSVAISPDGKRIVTGSYDRTAKLWDADNGHEIRTLKGHKELLNSVAFSPDGKRILTGSYDTTAKVWDAASGEEILVLHGHTGPLSGVAFSQDGTRIVTGSFDTTARVWDSRTGQQLLTLDGHTDAVWSVAFSPDGTRILTGSSDNTARLWETSLGQEVFTLKGHGRDAFNQGTVYGVSFSSDGRRIVTAGGDKTARVWDADALPATRNLRGHIHPIISVAFSPKGRRLFAWANEKNVRAWSMITGQSVEPVDAPAMPPPGPARSPDGQLTAVPRYKIVEVTDTRLVQPHANHWPLASRAERNLYHAEQAARAEKSNQRFAAAFHLGRLLRDDPDNADLKARRARALLEQKSP